jgi:hypothetical protein
MTDWTDHLPELPPALPDALRAQYPAMLDAARDAHANLTNAAHAYRRAIDDAAANLAAAVTAYNGAVRPVRAWVDAAFNVVKDDDSDLAGTLDGATLTMGDVEFQPPPAWPLDLTAPALLVAELASVPVNDRRPADACEIAEARAAADAEAAKARRERDDDDAAYRAAVL